MQTYNARLGMVLFIIYLALYAGFVFLNALSPESMEKITPFAGLNLAILYGFGLILAAFLFALLYGLLCRDDETPVATARGQQAGDRDTRSSSDKPQAGDNA